LHVRYQSLHSKHVLHGEDEQIAGAVENPCVAELLCQVVELEPQGQTGGLCQESDICVSALTLQGAYRQIRSQKKE